MNMLGFEIHSTQKTEYQTPYVPNPLFCYFWFKIYYYFISMFLWQWLCCLSTAFKWTEHQCTDADNFVLHKYCNFDDDDADYDDDDQLISNETSMQWWWWWVFQYKILDKINYGYSCWSCNNREQWIVWAYMILKYRLSKIMSILYSTWNAWSLFWFYLIKIIHTRYRLKNHADDPH